MSVFSMAGHLALLDIGWWVWLILGNLFWVFTMLAAHFIFSDGKKLLSGFAVLMIGLYAFTNFFDIMQIGFFSMMFLFISYMVWVFLLQKTRFERFTLLSYLSLYVVLAFVFFGFGWQKP